MAAQSAAQRRLRLAAAYEAWSQGRSSKEDFALIYKHLLKESGFASTSPVGISSETLHRVEGGRALFGLIYAMTHLTEAEKMRLETEARSELFNDV